MRAQPSLPSSFRPACRAGFALRATLPLGPSPSSLLAARERRHGGRLRPHRARGCRRRRRRAARVAGRSARAPVAAASARPSPRWSRRAPALPPRLPVHARPARAARGGKGARGRARAGRRQARPAAPLLPRLATRAPAPLLWRRWDRRGHCRPRAAAEPGHEACERVKRGDGGHLADSKTRQEEPSRAPRLEDDAVAGATSRDHRRRHRRLRRLRSRRRLWHTRLAPRRPWVPS